MKRYLGIDYGHARIGLAVGDDETKIAQPLKTLEKQADPVDRLREVAREQAVSAIVVGLPRGLDGQDTIQTGAIKMFTTLLQSLNLPIILQDEAGTTAQAKERLSHKAHIRTDVDMEAAAIILQDYLDNL